MALDVPLGPALSIDLESEVPIYRQIADELRRLVAQRVYAEGEPLPSVRDLGRQVGVNLNTVARAYRILAEEGLVELRPGASARVKHPRRGTHGQVATADEERRLRDLVARWVLRGADRSTVEALLASAVEHQFQGGTR